MGARVPVLVHPRYEPGEELGRGAQGVVVRVVDREAPDAALVAKVLRSSGIHDDAIAGEFALLARARIPGLAAAHDLARCARTGAPFLVEDFVDGPEADAWVNAEDRGASRAARLASVLADVATTLSRIHDAGFAHGDLKPAHVRVASKNGSPRAMVLDLGAAVTRASEGPIAFTPAFAAPEVAAGAPATALADLWGLGALAWSIATKRPPDRGRGASRASIRAHAPWVPPLVSDVVEALLATHPRDRPGGAREVLRRLGAAGILVAEPPSPIGRDREMERLVDPRAPAVRYLVGPSGSGKSHLAREMVTRALLSGRRARILRFPAAPGAILAGVVAFLRGSDVALPFLDVDHDAEMLLVLDDMHLAPPEVHAALELHRCRIERARHVSILATAREAPDGAEAITLGPLDDAGFEDLARALGMHDDAEIARARVASAKTPGWLVASAGAVPLTRDMAIDRARSLSPRAIELLAAIALLGGEASAGICGVIARGGEADLMRAALVDRRVEGARTTYALTAPALAPDLAIAFATFDRIDRVADVLLAQSDAPVAALLTLAAAPHPPSRRADLHVRAAAGARAEGLRAEEIDALFALAAEPARRTPDLLLRLERLTRDTGVATAHPRVLDWLDEAARDHAPMRTLALRRRAEKAARDGDLEAARDLAARAKSAAEGDPIAEALALGTEGLVALFAAAYTDAERALGEARARLASVEVHDPEEVARVDHNLGVVALYRGRHADATRAFERALTQKRALGDRAGMRSCLLNLGLSLAREGRLDDADRALAEAEQLARSLRQTAGRGWVLAAMADVAVRRGDAEIADRRIAEAAALAQALPLAVRADLSILRAQVALLEGDGARAIAEISSLDPGEREGDAMIDARALTIEASACFARLPVDRRKAARFAIAAVRRAREAGLPESEAQGLAVLRAARGQRRDDTGYAASVSRTPSHDATSNEPIWAWLAEVAAGASRDAAAENLARALAKAHGAERAFVASVDASGEARDAWGADLDGLPLAEARARLPLDLVRAAIAREAPVYQRDVVTKGGRGARLAIVRAGALVLIEHRFTPGAFDDVTPEEAARWATLAAIALRLDAPAPRSDRAIALSPSAAPVPAIDAHSTAFPLGAPRRSFPTILGKSAGLVRALARLDAAIDVDLPVLLVGETGTGKEVFARALHDHGPRASRAFVAVNCGAISDTLFEAELFGHARGSFTGADRARQGLIARANGGTLFLDEIGELPIARQAALLRALQERRYRPVGGDEEVSFDARVVAATNRDLDRAVEEGTFRRDLYYRLNAVEIRVPPLRDRRDDIPDLARAFLTRAGGTSAISPAAMAALTTHAWPGNVRELEHVMMRLSQLRVATIDIAHLPRQIRPAIAIAEAPAIATEKADVDRALAASGGNISRAAALLGMTRQGLKKRMVRLGMRAPKSEPETT